MSPIIFFSSSRSCSFNLRGLSLIRVPVTSDFPISHTIADDPALRFAGRSYSSAAELLIGRVAPRNVAGSNSTRKSIVSGIAFMISLVALAGCSSRVDDGYKGVRGTVTGTITLGGQPIPEGCRVTFSSLKGSYNASGIVDADGNYALVFNGSKNLPAVEYGVELSRPTLEQDGPKAQDPMEQYKKLASQSATKSPFPIRYSSRSTSKLEFTVQAGANTANFDLKP